MNPWEALNKSQNNLTDATNSAYGAIGSAQQAYPGAQMQLSSNQSSMNNYAGIDYPAMSQSAAIQSPNQTASVSAPSAQATPDSSSRGFNPWSLQGEANSR